MEKKTNFFDELEKKIYNSQKYFGTLELIEFMVFLIIIYKYNPFNISSTYPAYTQLGVLIVGFIYIILFFFIKYNFIQKLNLFNLGLENPTEFNIVKRIMFTIGFLLLFIITTFGIFWLFTHKNVFFGLFKYSVAILSIVGILGIIYLLTNKLFSGLFNFNTDGRAGGYGPAIEILILIKNLILFLPCLLISFVETMRYEFNITTKPVWIILIMEIILISSWFIVPKLMNIALNKNGTLLLKEPLYLNQEHTLGDFENMHLNIINNDNKTKFNYNYAISAWFTINPQPPNTRISYTKYTNILNYGNKPAITYNGEKNILLVNTQVGRDTTNNTNNTNNSRVEIFETKNIEFQKWNNIVINYDGGTMDVFLNGVLVGSRQNIAPYMTYESITVGENKGIEGAICNVIYYDKILSNRTIKLVYNYLKNKEIPLL
jgi:hypothetical protein